MWSSWLSSKDLVSFSNFHRTRSTSPAWLTLLQPRYFDQRLQPRGGVANLQPSWICDFPSDILCEIVFDLKFSTRTLPFLCRQEAGYTRNQMTDVPKCVVGQLSRDVLWKTNPGKVTGKNYRGLRPPGWRRVNKVDARDLVLEISQDHNI